MFKVPRGPLKLCKLLLNFVNGLQMLRVANNTVPEENVSGKAQAAMPCQFI